MLHRTAHQIPQLSTQTQSQAAAYVQKAPARARPMDGHAACTDKGPPRPPSRIICFICSKICAPTQGGSPADISWCRFAHHIHHRSRCKDMALVAQGAIAASCHKSNQLVSPNHDIGTLIMISIVHIRAGQCPVPLFNTPYLMDSWLWPIPPWITPHVWAERLPVFSPEIGGGLLAAGSDYTSMVDDY